MISIGRMLQADSSKVSTRAKKRGLPQLGTLGAGNHYGEVQVVDEIYDRHAAQKMGIDSKGQICMYLFDEKFKLYASIRKLFKILEWYIVAAADLAIRVSQKIFLHFYS